MVDLHDDDAPSVIIAQARLDRRARGQLIHRQLLCSPRKAPSASVTVTIDAVNTRTTLSGTARFRSRWKLSLDKWSSSPRSSDVHHDRLGQPQYGLCRAIDDTVSTAARAGLCSRVHTVNKIRGPLLIEGAAGAGSLSLPAPLMLPGEINLRPSDGTVGSFAASSGEGAIELMTVATVDLQALIDDPTKDFGSLADFIGKTLELTEGPGTGVVLDAARPLDLYDRFCCFNDVVNLGGGLPRPHPANLAWWTRACS